MANVSQEINQEARQDVWKVLVFSGKAIVTGSRLAKALNRTVQQKNDLKPGRTSIKKLTANGQGLASIEITEKNIKTFEPVAKKYGVRFALKKDSSIDPPKYLVFFRSNNADTMTAAFREFSEKALQKGKKPSIISRMQEIEKEKLSQAPERDPIRKKTHGEQEL